MAAVIQTGSAVPLQTRPLSPNIGAEVMGVDLSRPLDAATAEAIRQAWYANCILLFRGQSITEEQQVAFGATFGELGRVLNKHGGASRHHPGVMFVSNVRENGELIGALPDGEMMFHSDQCYVARPSAAAMLYAMEVPSKGGNTLFANAYKAYDAVPAELKAKLEGARAVNVYDYANAATHRGTASAEAPRFAHPVFRTHPETGKRALYVNRLMTESIVGWDKAEGDRVLAQLFDLQENPAWIYEHVWKPGDLLVWDNRCALHARSDFDASERRLMRRCVVLGEIPN